MRNRFQKRINFSLLLKRNYIKILIIGILTCLIIFPILFLQVKKVYVAKADLRINPIVATPTPGFDSSLNSILPFYGEYVATQKFKITKEKNILKALQLMSENELRAMIGSTLADNAAAHRVSTRISILTDSDTLILSINVKGDNPDGIAPFLNNLIEIYLEEIRSENDMTLSNQMDFLLNHRSEITEKIDALTDKIKAISTEIGTSNFDSNEMPLTDELKVQSEAYIRAKDDRLMKEKQYNSFIADLDRLKSFSTNSEVQEQSKNDVSATEQKKFIIAKINELQSSLNELTPENPQRKIVEEKIEAQMKALQDLENQVFSKYQEIVKADNNTNLEKQLFEYFRQYSLAKKFEDEMEKAYGKIQERYSFSSKQASLARTYKDEIESYKLELSQVRSSLVNVKGEKQSSGRVFVENFAERPSSHDMGAFIKPFIFGFIFSFAWIIFVVIAREYFDQRIKSVEELKAFSGIKPLWPISDLAEGNFLTVSFKKTDTRMNNPLRSLSIRIHRELDKFESKIFTFSGIISQSGVSEIVLNSAHHMKGLCDKILVIEIKKGSDTLIKKISLDSPLSIEKRTEHFIKNIDFDISIFYDRKRGIDILSLPDDLSISNRQLDQLLLNARNSYELVLVDVEPLLKSDLTEYIFMKSDSVIFVVLGNYATYPDLKITLELAEKIELQSVGLAVNWWKGNKKQPTAMTLFESIKKHSKPKLT